MQTQKKQHTYSMWFLQNRLNADYGRFTCERCKREFYHSPSAIYYDDKEKYECCCGHCTNEIIHQDWNARPYE
jgi:hypothetical protein